MREHLAGVPHQHDQQLVFRRREMHLPFIHEHLSVLEIDTQVVRDEDRVVRLPAARAAWRRATRMRAKSSPTPNGLVR